MAILFFFPLIISFLMVALIVGSNAFHARFTNDSDLSSTQKFHEKPVPRIGGAALFAGLSSVGFLDLFSIDKSWFSAWTILLAASLPIFLIGLSEDITKKISPRTRLWFSFLSAALLFFMVNVHFNRVDWLWLDSTVLSIGLISFLVTALIAVGVSHAMNIIDGFNGLMLGVGFLMFMVIAIVSSMVNDTQILSYALVCAGSTAGVFLLNFPFGKIFTGDGGAYLMGFLLASLSMMLVQRNREVSAWFPCLLLSYPVFETLFSIYRKLILRKMSPIQPDGIHLHMLIYKRITKNNAMTSCYLWALALVGIIPAVVFWNNTAMILVFCLIFSMAYLQLYWSLVRFKHPFSLCKCKWFKYKALTE